MKRFFFLVLVLASEAATASPALSTSDPVFVDDLVIKDGAVLVDHRPVASGPALDAAPVVMVAPPRHSPSVRQFVIMGVLFLVAGAVLSYAAFREFRGLMPPDKPD
jgi:hypothetical protein